MDEYINKLMQEQGVPDNLDPDVRAQLYADLSQRAVDFMNRRLIDAMDGAAIDEFQALLETNPTDPAVIQNFVTSHVADRDRVVADALIEFRELYLGSKA